MDKASILGIITDTAAAPVLPSRTCYLIILVLLLVSTLNYGDRGILFVTGSAIQSEFALTPVQMGWILSAFAWAYVLGQLPGDWLLDRYGSKRTYAVSVFCWSLLILVQVFNEGSAINLVVTAFFALSSLVGLVEAPAAPGKSRRVNSWFSSALIEALSTGQIAGAALDVLVDEPKGAAALSELDTVVLPPSVPNGAKERRLAMADRELANLAALSRSGQWLHPMRAGAH